MAIKKPAINVTISKALGLTSTETATLKNAFKMEIARVLKARPPGGDAPPFPDVNVGGGASGGSRRPGVKKSAKAGASKKR